MEKQLKKQSKVKNTKDKSISIIELTTNKEVKNIIITKQSEIEDTNKIVRISNKVNINNIRKGIRRQTEKTIILRDKIERLRWKEEESRKVREQIHENKEYKDIDIFYRPVFNHDIPFDPQKYHYEIARLRKKQTHAQKLLDEINEDRETIENYKKITTSRIYIPRRLLKKPTCIDQILEAGPSSVKKNIVMNFDHWQ